MREQCLFHAGLRLRDGILVEDFVGLFPFGLGCGGKVEANMCIEDGGVNSGRI